MLVKMGTFMHGIIWELIPEDTDKGCLANISFSLFFPTHLNSASSNLTPTLSYTHKDVAQSWFLHSKSVQSEFSLLLSSLTSCLYIYEEKNFITPVCNCFVNPLLTIGHSVLILMLVLLLVKTGDIFEMWLKKVINYVDINMKKLFLS